MRRCLATHTLILSSGTLYVWSTCLFFFCHHPAFDHSLSTLYAPDVSAPTLGNTPTSPPNTLYSVPLYTLATVWLQGPDSWPCFAPRAPNQTQSGRHVEDVTKQELRRSPVSSPLPSPQLICNADYIAICSRQRLEVRNAVNVCIRKPRREIQQAGEQEHLQQDVVSGVEMVYLHCIGVVLTRRIY